MTDPKVQEQLAEKIRAACKELSELLQQGSAVGLDVELRLHKPYYDDTTYTTSSGVVIVEAPNITAVRRV